MAVRRGEIYWVEFDPVKGSEQAGLALRLRPVQGEAEVRPIGKLSVAKMVEVDGALSFNLALR